MGRWIAIGRASGWEELETLTAQMKGTENWRVTPKTSITSVFILGDGRLLAECQGESKADFETWLRQRNWRVEDLVSVGHVARTGDIWPDASE